VWARDSLLNLVQNFVQVVEEEDDDGKKKKKPLNSKKCEMVINYAAWNFQSPTYSEFVNLTFSNRQGARKTSL
jgi:hypothetical protein